MAPRVPMLIVAASGVLLASCASSLGDYRFESVERVAREAIAAPDTFEPKQAPYPWYLRVHFSSKSDLNALAETRDSIDARADICPMRDPPDVAVLGPYAVGQSLAVRSRTAGGVSTPGLARLVERDANGRYAYTAYVVPMRSAPPAYDLAAPPRDLCLRLDAQGGPKGPERSNVFVAPAAAIAAAVAAP